MFANYTLANYHVMFILLLGMFRSATMLALAGSNGITCSLTKILNNINLVNACLLCIRRHK